MEYRCIHFLRCWSRLWCLFYYWKLLSLAKHISWWITEADNTQVVNKSSDSHFFSRFFTINSQFMMLFWPDSNVLLHKIHDFIPIETSKRENTIEFVINAFQKYKNRYPTLLFSVNLKKTILTIQKSKIWDWNFPFSSTLKPYPVWYRNLGIFRRWSRFKSQFFDVEL